MQMDRTRKLALVSLLFNMVYSAYHIIFGIATHSWWFFTIGIYYAILSIVRFVILRHKGKKHFVIRFTGIMLMVLSLSLVGTVILAFVKDRGTEFHLIVMLAIAVYAFTKTTLAIIGVTKDNKNKRPAIKCLRNLSLADAAVSIFALQRSMLVSFEGMSAANIQLMNALTGTAVYMFIALLGINLIGGKKCACRQKHKEKKKEKTSFPKGKEEKYRRRRAEDPKECPLDLVRKLLGKKNEKEGENGKPKKPTVF